jgi:uncharacterized membrane protein YjjB (DUF3815 family)
MAVLLPGLSLTIALVELSTRNLVCGTVRLCGALFTSLVLGFGITLGNLAVWWVEVDQTTEKSCPDAPSLNIDSHPLYYLLFFPPLCLSINIFFQSHVRQVLLLLFFSETALTLKRLTLYKIVASHESLYNRGLANILRSPKNPKPPLIPARANIHLGTLHRPRLKPLLTSHKRRGSRSHPFRHPSPSARLHRRPHVAQLVCE